MDEDEAPKDEAPNRADETEAQEKPAEELPPPIMGGAADKASAGQRQASQDAPRAGGFLGRLGRLLRNR
jgi:hypothetical protein